MLAAGAPAVRPVNIYALYFLTFLLSVFCSHALALIWKCYLIIIVVRGGGADNDPGVSLLRNRDP